MYTEIQIKTWEDLLQLLDQREYQAEIKRYRSTYLYRGLSNSNYSLVTSLERNCKDKSQNLESSILRNFAKYAASEDPSIVNSVWRQLIIGQHHGLPTRLMDWTYSPLISLHFAVSEGNLDSLCQHDCAVWRIDISEIHDRLPTQYKACLQKEKAYLFTVDMLEKIVQELSKYDTDMQQVESAMVVVEPPSIDPRIINQYSYFTVVPFGIGKMEDFLRDKTNNTVKYIIDKGLRWRIRDMLDQMNINERTTYPGLDGLTKWLARHYFVQAEK